MIRIGLSGTNWTRKTTTIRELCRALAPLPVDIVSLSSLVDRCPYPMGRGQTLDASRWMVAQVEHVLERSLPPDSVQVFDRTPLDILAFTRYAADQARLRGEQIEGEEVALEKKILSLGDVFMLLWLCRPADEWPAPESPFADALQFAQTIDTYLCRAVESFGAKVIELPWFAPARLARILDFVTSQRNCHGFTVHRHPRRA